MTTLHMILVGVIALFVAAAALPTKPTAHGSLPKPTSPAGDCTLYVLTTTQVFEAPKLTHDDAVAKYWEMEKHEEHADVAMAAVYCGGKLILIQDTTNVDAVPGGGPVEAPK